MLQRRLCSTGIFSFVPLIGLNIGMISLIGRFVGARDPQRADEVVTAGFVIGLTYSAVLAGLYIVFRFPLVEIFAPPEGDLLRFESYFMMVGLSSYAMADAVIQVTGGVLRGAGDTRWLMVASVSLHWAAGSAIFHYQVFELGPKVAWLAFVALIFAIAVVFVIRLRGERWRDEEALARVMAE